MSPSIQFTYQLNGVRIRQANKVRAWINSVATAKKKNIKQINYIFCSNKYIKGINQQFLNHDYATDIVTFDLSPNKRNLIAEIYIGYEVVRANAKTYKVTVTEELHRVMVHGLLHLLGYDDKESGDASQMRKAEDACLSKRKWI